MMHGQKNTKIYLFKIKAVVDFFLRENSL